MRPVPPHCIEPFLASANRRHLMGGMEFGGWILSLYVPFVIGISVPTLKVIAGCIVLFLVLRFIFRAMAKKDPFMMELYRDAWAYKQKDGTLEFPAVSETA